MPHNYNRREFASGVLPTSPLLSLYCSLVVIELSIKDHLNPRPSGHNVIDWLTTLGEPSLAQQLRSALTALLCTDRSGNEAPVEGSNYPGLRYLRHETDFPGKTTDSQVKDALDIVLSVNAALLKKGVL